MKDSTQSSESFPLYDIPSPLLYHQPREDLGKMWHPLTTSDGLTKLKALLQVMGGKCSQSSLLCIHPGVPAPITSYHHTHKNLYPLRLVTHGTWSNIDNIGMECAQDLCIFEELNFIHGSSIWIGTSQKHNVMVGVWNINYILHVLHIVRCIVDMHELVLAHLVMLQYHRFQSLLLVTDQSVDMTL